MRISIKKAVWLYYSNFLFFKSHISLGDLLTLSKLFWKILLVKKKLRTPAFTGYSPVQEKSGIGEVTFSYRVDVFFRLLVPAALFVTVFKSYKSVFLNTYTYLIISPQSLDVFNLLLFSNPLFLNTKLFDISAFINNLTTSTFKVLYYVYKLPTFSTWLILFTPYENLSSNLTTSPKILSVEKLFKAASWAEREISELFGIFFFSKVTNRKLITGYFFKVYPLLKWGPSVGFTEVYCSAEGFFSNRSVKVFNSALS